METITRALIDDGKVPVGSAVVKLRGGALCVNVRKMTADEMIAMVALRDVESKSEKENLDSMADILIGVCVEEDGKQIFADGDRALVLKTFTLDDINTIIAEVTGVELEKKSSASSGAPGSG